MYIYNFYTFEQIWAKGGDGHTEDVTCLVWDTDDTGFATCGLDGKAIYWQLYNREIKYVDFFNKEYKFLGVDIVHGQDDAKKLVLIDGSSLYEITGPPKDRLGSKDIEYSLSKGGMSRDKPKVLMKERVGEDIRATIVFSQVLYNQDSKIVITSMKKEHSPCLRLARYIPQNPSTELKQDKLLDKDAKELGKDKDKVKENSTLLTVDVKDYQANSLGVNCFKVSQDMSHLFTCGKDRCLFIFQFQNIQKSDKHEETLESDLMLVKKEELDDEADILKGILNKIEQEIQNEEENFRKIISQKEAERIELEKNYEEEKRRFTKEKDDLQTKINEQRDIFEAELSEIRDNFESKIKELQEEHSKNIRKKEEDRKKEQDNLEKEKKKDSDQLVNLKKRLIQEEKELTEKFENKMQELEEEIKLLEKEKNEITAEIAEKKEESMKNNDIKITNKREQLEDLRRCYLNAENEFKKKKETFEKEINDKKELIKAKEIKKGEERKKLQGLQDENEKLAKQIKVNY